MRRMRELGYVEPSSPRWNLPASPICRSSCIPKRVEPGARSDDAVGLRAYNQLAKTVCPLPRRGRNWPQPLGLAIRSPNQ